MLRYRSIKPFNGWMDAGMRLAKLYVKVWTNSNHFTLTEYNGKDDFYDFANESFVKFVDKLNSIENKYRYRDEYVSDLNRALKWSIKTSTLTIERLFYILASILFLIDISEDIINDKHLAHSEYIRNS